VGLQRRMDTSSHMQVLLELNVDKQPSVLLLYSPEQLNPLDPNLYLWVRRCTVFVDHYSVMKHLHTTLGIDIKDMYKHELFPELTIMEDTRGYKWYLERAPVHGYTN
jgi:hypothetical protein